MVPLTRSWWLAAILLALSTPFMLRAGLLLLPDELLSECEQPHWTFRIVSYDPLIAHIENLITVSERRHLLELKRGAYIRSRVCFSNNDSSAETPGRTSSTGYLPRSDPTVRCIMKRAAEIQGFIPVSFIEIPQITHYEVGQEYRGHYNWKIDENGFVADRKTTIFAILESSCFDCGTNFPLIETHWDSEEDELCKFFECRNTTLVTKPVLGSALFWRNTLADGRGDRRTLHAGLPVPSGFKSGLNIWTRV